LQINNIFGDYLKGEMIMKSKTERHQNTYHSWSLFVRRTGFKLFLVIAFIIVLLISYKLGTSLANLLVLTQWVTTIGVLTVPAGILFIYNLVRSKKNNRKVSLKGEHAWPVIEPSIEDVRKAVRAYSEKLPKGVYRTILVREDNSINFEQLAPIMKGIPSRKFYMSKETYDIFNEDEKEIAITIDTVQKAVDLYVKENKQYPKLQYDPLNRVNYYQLMQAHCLNFTPEIELYITDYDGLVTHIRPKKNSTGD
jgi:hypothetical protein